MLVGIRAESIEASAEPLDGGPPATAEVVEPLGSHNLVTARLGGHPLKLSTRTDFRPGADGQLWLRPESGKLRWFDATTGVEL